MLFRSVRFVKTYRECRERFLVEAQTLGDQNVLELNDRGIEDMDNADGVDNGNMNMEVVGALSDGQTVDAAIERGPEDVSVVIAEQGHENAGATIVGWSHDNAGVTAAAAQEVAVTSDIAANVENVVANTSLGPSSTARSDVSQDSASILTWNVIAQNVEIPSIEIFHNREGQGPPAMVSSYSVSLFEPILTYPRRTGRRQHGSG